MFKFKKLFLRKIGNTLFEQYMVLIQSYYKAASIYYFSRNYEFAYNVISDGLEFLKSIKSELYSTDKKHVDVWFILLKTLETDIMNHRDKKDQNAEMTALNELFKEEKQFDRLDYGSFPSSAVLLFRRYFLDDSISGNRIVTFEKWLKNKNLWISLDDDILYRKHIALYKFLVFFLISNEYNDKLNNIFKAIQRPVLSTEDRLLNFEATEWTLETIGSCINLTGDSLNSENCYDFQGYVNNNKDITDLQSTILPKLRILYGVRNRNLIQELYIELTKDDHIIEQDILHYIVSAAIDIDKESKTYEKNIENVKLAIKLLQAFVKSHSINLNDMNSNDKHKTNKANQEKNKTNKKKITNESSLEIDYDKISKTIYTKETQINNIFIAYKWLIELNGILCSHSIINTYSASFVFAEHNINTLAKNEKELLHTDHIKDDEHFMFLKAKRMSKLILSLNKWETANRPGGWILSGIPFNFTEMDKKTKETLQQLIYLKNNSKCPYINRIEIFTLIFRFQWKLKLDYFAMYTSIKSAIYEIVVTPEDRWRNLEAHELFTMFLMERNELGIKLMNVLEITQVYNTFLMDPDSRYKVK
ncbi:uncharacterized protein LOC112595687 [Melanaphis sacchari]|uniref:uncharacterized protein LOC112595687 n=1 Tax=Melanaphis sacchari TaxID=742174 RepID=UPI000DC13588|nr:uncharacterized protein LOC112595687 [Melanaphis sacchari]